MMQGCRLSRFATSVALGVFLIASAAAARADATVSADPAFAPLTDMHSVYMSMVPQSPYSTLQHLPASIPLLTGVDRATWFARKAAARYNRLAPYDPRPIPAWYEPSDAFYTPGLLASFAGLSDSATTCPYFGGCAPPDMALAASSSFVLQGVNTSFAVYSTTGAIKAGFPKDFTHFFHIPAPAPAGCDPAGPFTSDPRALYDPTDGRFWVTVLQIEGAFLNSCTEKTTYWVGVSKTSDPTGGWNIYAFNMALGTTNFADYTQIGLDPIAFYFGANMFDVFGSSYMYDEVFAADKAKMEAGLAVTAHGLKSIKLGGVLIDTLQPVLVEGAKTGGTGLFVDAFNFNSGGGSCSTSCSGITVWAMANPLTAPSFTVKTAPTKSYSFPPAADQPGAPASVETIDTRITGTPVYRGGIISWAHETAVTHATTTVPGIHWGQVMPTIAAGKITAVSTVQNAILSFTGDRAASFGTVMTDATGDLLMVFDSMSSTINPGAYYASRLSTDPLGTLEPPKVLKAGVVPTFESRWGDYEATSYDGSMDDIWFATQYSNSLGDWSTQIGKAKP